MSGHNAFETASIILLKEDLSIQSHRPMRPSAVGLCSAASHIVATAIAGNEANVDYDGYGNTLPAICNGSSQSVRTEDKCGTASSEGVFFLTMTAIDDTNRRHSKARAIKRRIGLAFIHNDYQTIPPSNPNFCEIVRIYCRSSIASGRHKSEDSRRSNCRIIKSLQRHRLRRIFILLFTKHAL